MGYFDWHEQPGYFRDVTRHFDPSARLLDVGCGTGWLAEHFRDYTGVDGSPDAVSQAPAAATSCWGTSTSRCPSPTPRSTAWC
jgi:SAM-dependent methyltransferase